MDMIKTDLWTMSNTLFLEWSSLKILIDFRLSSLLDRPISSLPFQDGDYWDVDTDPITAHEMKRLFQIAGADEKDIEDHSNVPEVTNITDMFTQKLISAELPFSVKTTVSTYNGVYFIGQDIPYSKIYRIKEVSANVSK